MTGRLLALCAALCAAAACGGDEPCEPPSGTYEFVGTSADPDCPMMNEVIRLRDGELIGEEGECVDLDTERSDMGCTVESVRDCLLPTTTGGTAEAHFVTILSNVGDGRYEGTSEITVAIGGVTQSCVYDLTYTRL